MLSITYPTYLQPVNIHHVEELHVAQTAPLQDPWNLGDVGNILDVGVAGNGCAGRGTMHCFCSGSACHTLLLLQPSPSPTDGEHVIPTGQIKKKVSIPLLIGKI